eukprot:gene25662-31379_t
MESLFPEAVVPLLNQTILSQGIDAAIFYPVFLKLHWGTIYNLSCLIYATFAFVLLLRERIALLIYDSFGSAVQSNSAIQRKVMERPFRRTKSLFPAYENRVFSTTYARWYYFPLFQLAGLYIVQKDGMWGWFGPNAQSLLLSLFLAGYGGEMLSLYFWLFFSVLEVVRDTICNQFPAKSKDDAENLAIYQVKGK